MLLVVVRDVLEFDSWQGVIFLRFVVLDAGLPLCRRVTVVVVGVGWKGGGPLPISPILLLIVVSFPLRG